MHNELYLFGGFIVLKKLSKSSVYISNLALEKVPKKFDRGIRFISWGPGWAGSRLRFYTTASSAAEPVRKPARLTRFIWGRLGWSRSSFALTLWWKAFCASARVVCPLGAWLGPLLFRFGFTFTLWWISSGAFACVVGSLWTSFELFLRMFTNTLWWEAFGATVA